MRFQFIKKLLTNNLRFKSDHPDYEKVYLLNAILLTIIIVSALFAILNITFPCHPDAAYINIVATLFGTGVFIYFHLTDKYELATYITVGMLFLALISYYHIVGLMNYTLFWIIVLPPVAYFLLGRKTGRIVVAAFCTYMLYFILSRYKTWAPTEMNIIGIFNVAGAASGLILLISYYENSRNMAIEALKKSTVAIEEHKNELRLILDSTAEGIYGLDNEGICTFCNSRCLELLGYEHESDLIGKKIHDLIQYKNRDGYHTPWSECEILNVITTGHKVHVEEEIFWKSDGTSIDVEYLSYPKFQESVIIGAVITFMDITERKKHKEKVEYLSAHDQLTGMKNRQWMETELFKCDIQENLPLSVVYGDLNGLKLTNDIFGHASGDLLIQKTAAIIKESCRDCDIAARVGGDEFIILLPSTSADQAKVWIENIKTKLSKEKVSAITCSIAMGFDTKVSMDQNILEVCKSADNEMYYEKCFLSKNTGNEMLKDIISSLHERSPREKSHSEEICKLCAKMGMTLGLSEAEIRRLKDMGYYHDIGKIVLSDKLLSKNEKLNVQEKSEKRQHPIVGYRILNLFDNTLDLAEPVCYHHERWNGSGYPIGLKEKEIPLYSRIIAITEKYEYLTNGTNIEPLSQEEALKNISQDSGIKFDPDLVTVFIKMMSDPVNPNDSIEHIDGII